MYIRFTGRINQLMPAVNLWSVDWIAGMMLQDLLAECPGWQVETPLQALPLGYLSYGFRANNNAHGQPVKLVAQADEEGMRTIGGQQSYIVVVQARFETPVAWGPGAQNTLIPQALNAMQATFAAAAPEMQFWFPAP